MWRYVTGAKPPAKKAKTAEEKKEKDKVYETTIRERQFQPSWLEKDVKSRGDLFDGAADAMRGKASVAVINCGEDKKLCKKLKVNPVKLTLKHYKDGEFNKDYDRKMEIKSMVSFLSDPTGDKPWEEEDGAQDVLHLEDANALSKLISREKKPILVMFYAPWCGHCKRFKPEFQAAAAELKGQAVLAGMDANKQENMAVRMQYNITGFPTTIYFQGGQQKFNYGAEPNKDALVEWIKHPEPPKAPEPEASWADEPSEVVHLTDDTFQDFLTEHPSALVMFYAPWCGHCKKMKPEYTAAASNLKEQEIDGALAALDATAHPISAKKFDVKGYPHVIYFKEKKLVDAQRLLERVKQGPTPSPQLPPQPSSPLHETPSRVIGELRQLVSLPPGNKRDVLDGMLKDLLAKKVIAKVPQNTPGHYSQVFLVPKSSGGFRDGEQQFKVNHRTQDKLVDFMKDPEEPTPEPSETPWEDTESDVIHLTDDSFKPALKKRKHALVMFYAPWCGHCKNAKPHFMAAAETFKDNTKVAFAAMDCTRHQSSCSQHEVQGYPTFKYFNYGKNDQKYTGGREEADFVNFMSDPLNPLSSAPPPPPDPREQWAEVDPTEQLVHLSTPSAQQWLDSHGQVLVMFYAPWCGHCKNMKPAFAEAAATLAENDNIDGYLAAVDATAETALAQKYGIKGYPTLKYFKDGNVEFDYEGGRTTQDLLGFMNKPQAPVPKPMDTPWADVQSEVVHLTSQDLHSYLREHEHVLVMFYAPWCGHCKKAKPEYQEAAEVFKDAADKTLAAVDCTQAKDLCSEQGVKGYPTFLLYERGALVEKYEKERNKAAFVSFMRNPPAAKHQQHGEL